ncbi:MAG: VOC family protein [Leptolyngbya sp. SIO1E4]|nr:VOC family protein [Leptolyngbya sp. SIO1E4]
MENRRTKPEVGQILWHDLLTNDVAKAKHFYGELLGWQYQIEHATDFVWQPGEADYPLIFVHGEAHGGFVEVGQDVPSRWVAYVGVEAVDAVTAKAQRLGATLDRPPFDIPGVGRSALIRDLQGAIICPYVATHSFPPPSGTFLWDELITPDVEPAKRFYGELFGWQANDVDWGPMGGATVFKGPDDIGVAGAIARSQNTASPAVWVPYLAATNMDVTVAQAKALGAIVQTAGTNVPNLGRLVVLTDPTGALFGLLARSNARQP